MWYHIGCFFDLQRPQSINVIENYENIRYEDQQKIQVKLKEIHQVLMPVTSSSGSVKSKGKKRPASIKIVLNDFGVEYSVSGRAECVGCRSKIVKDIVRVKKTVYHTEVGMKFGGQPFWHHLECFAQIRSDEYGFYLSGEKLPGFKSLSEDDQDIVRKALP
jgi:poly [ADP-ribose] polymerase 1